MEYTNGEADGRKATPTNDPDDYVNYPTDAEDIELDGIDLYEATYLEADIALDHCDQMEDGDRDLLHDCDKPSAPPSTPVAAVPMMVPLSEIMAAQKTDDFCQTFLATMGPAN